MDMCLRFCGATNINLGNTDQSMGFRQVRIQCQCVFKVSDALRHALGAKLERRTGVSCPLTASPNTRQSPTR